MMEKVCSSMCSASPVAPPSGSCEMSTAMITSAPISRAERTGTGDVRPPSTYSCVPILTGVNTAGTALEARTAVPTSPRRNRIGLPLSRSVATMPSGIFNWSNERLPTCSRT